MLLPLSLHCVGMEQFVDPCQDYTKIEVVEPAKADVELLAKLIYCEAASEPYEGKLAVGQVVINRMKRRDRTLAQVIFRPGQFDGVTAPWYGYTSKECKKAAWEVLRGRKVLPDDIYYFYNPVASTDREWISKLTTYVQIKNHVFSWYLQS